MNSVTPTRPRENKRKPERRWPNLTPRETWRRRPRLSSCHARGLGKKSEAIDALEEGFARGGGGEMVWLNVDPRYDTLRSDPRFQRLLRAAGFVR